MENVIFLAATWAERMAQDVRNAKEQIIMTALSMQQARGNSHGSWHGLWSALLEAPGRGVAVKIWLPQPHHAHPATMGNYTTAVTLAKAGIVCQLVKDSRLLHAKTCVIDEQIAYVGSGNYTAAACNHNHEAYLRVDCKKLALDVATRWELLP